MIKKDQLTTFRQRIESELAGLLDWIEAPEIRSHAKDRLMRRQNVLKAAFIRIQQGSFGCCPACGNAIEPALLYADPAISLCAACHDEKHAGQFSSPVLGPGHE